MGKRTFSVENAGSLEFAFRFRDFAASEATRERERGGGGLRSTGCIISSSISNIAVVVVVVVVVHAHSRSRAFTPEEFQNLRLCPSEANISTYYNEKSILRHTIDRTLPPLCFSPRVIPRHFPQSDLSSFVGITRAFFPARSVAGVA